MTNGRASLLMVCLLATSACYHQVIQTGKAPGPNVVEKPWTSTWLWGIVPAQPIDVTPQCTSGIATVETKQSFMNGLVGALTLGIWSPRSVKVTCASSSALAPGMREFFVAKNATPEERATTISAAIAESDRRDQAVVIRF